MVILTTAIFCIVPMISVPLLILGACCNKKNRIVYLILLAFILAIIAYHWIPNKEFDLYRYYMILNRMRTIGFTDFITKYINQKEIISNFLFFIISRLTTNNSMLQFITTFIGYVIMFYILEDYAKNKKNSNIIFTITFFYIISSFRYLTFISGIRNTLAIMIFALGMYLEYIKKVKRWKCNLLYFSTIFIHISSLLIFVLKIIYTYIFKEKIDMKKIIIISIVFLIPDILLNVINKFSTISIFSNLQKMYIAYFINGSQFDAITGGNILIMNIVRAFFCILIYYLYKEKNNKLNNYVLILLIVLIAITFQSKEFIRRYVFLGEILSMPMLMDCYEKVNKKIKITLICGIMLFSILLFYLQIKGLFELNFGNLFSEQLLANIFTIFNK